MSTTDVTRTTEVPASTPRSAPPSNGRHRADESPPAAADRGHLEIADQVVEKIAAAALGEVDQIGGVARRVLGVPLGSEDPDRAARVSAAVNGSVVTLDVRATVAYPAPVAATTERARAYLVDRIGELTGLDARQVDITVTALTIAIADDRRELR